MTQISVSDLKANAGKYVGMAQDQDILITKNGKVVAKLVTARPDKKASWDSIVGVFRTANIELSKEDAEKDREERILQS